MPGPIVTSTTGGFAAWTERAKDIFVRELRSFFSLQFSQNVIKEMPNIERYGLAGQTSVESFVNIFTTLPHEMQRVPFIAVMSSPATERKMGIGRQVIGTFRDPNTGLPTVRECVGGDMNVIIELSATDTNMRAELTDLVYSFFTHYMEERLFSFLGSAETDSLTGAQNLYQLILKSQATLQGETDTPRPDGEGFDRLYFNRVTVPIIFIDYVDREVDDFAIRYNPNLLPQDDYFFDKYGVPLPFDESEVLHFANTDSFESTITLSGAARRWTTYTTPYALSTHTTSTDEVLLGTGSLKFSTGLVDTDACVGVVSFKEPEIVTGKIRGKFHPKDDNAEVVLFSMLQGANPLTSSSYHLRIPVGIAKRFQLYKGAIAGNTAQLIAQSSKTSIYPNEPFVAQLDWRIDTVNNRIRLRGWVSPYESTSYGALDKRLEFIDDNSPMLTTTGEGFGCKESTTASGVLKIIVDDVDVLENIAPGVFENPAKILKPKFG